LCVEAGIERIEVSQHNLCISIASGLHEQDDRLVVVIPAQKKKIAILIQQ
jgi:hypothetical protein